MKKSQLSTLQPVQSRMYISPLSYSMKFIIKVFQKYLMCCVIFWWGLFALAKTYRKVCFPKCDVEKGKKKILPPITLHYWKQEKRTMNKKFSLSSYPNISV